MDGFYKLSLELKLGIETKEQDFNKLSTLYFFPLIEIKNILKKKIQNFFYYLKLVKR